METWKHAMLNHGRESLLKATYQDQGTGQLKLVLFQLGANGNIITQQTKTINPNDQGYQKFEDVTPTNWINPNTKTLRFTFYLETSQTFKVDAMFLEKL